MCGGRFGQALLNPSGGRSPRPVFRCRILVHGIPTVSTEENKRHAPFLTDLTRGRVLALPRSRFGPESRVAYGVVQKCAPMACSLQPMTLTLAAGYWPWRNASRAVTHCHADA